jgi:mannose-6-phosphate isomerase-like protein (cupin superfamily)
MPVIDPQHHSMEEWRFGVQTRMLVSAMTNSQQPCIFEQWCAPGTGAPTHSHVVEEVLTVLDGQAEFWVGADRIEASVGQSVLIPAGRQHGFRNTGTKQLHVQAVLAAPIFEAWRSDNKEPTRHWSRANTHQQSGPR